MGNAKTYHSKLYNSIEGSLANATINSLVAHANVNEIFWAAIKNDSDADDFTVRINDVANDVMTVKAGEELVISEIIITSIYLSNSSGSSIDYRIKVFGKLNPTN